MNLLWYIYRNYGQCCEAVLYPLLYPIPHKIGVVWAGVFFKTKKWANVAPMPYGSINIDRECSVKAWLK